RTARPHRVGIAHVTVGSLCVHALARGHVTHLAEGTAVRALATTRHTRVVDALFGCVPAVVVYLAARYTHVLCHVAVGLRVGAVAAGEAGPLDLAEARCRVAHRRHGAGFAAHVAGRQALASFTHVVVGAAARRAARDASAHPAHLVDLGAVVAHLTLGRCAAVAAGGDALRRLAVGCALVIGWAVVDCLAGLGAEAATGRWDVHTAV